MSGLANLVTMATLKIVLDQRRAKLDGTYPLVLRITFHTKSRSIPLKIFLKPNQWDEKEQVVKKNHPNQKLLNHTIATKRLEVEGVILKLEQKGKPFSIQTILSAFGNTPANSDFLEYGFSLVEQLRQLGKFGNATAYATALRKLQNFAGNKALDFEDLDYSFLQRFQTSMLQEGMKVNAISVYLRSLRAIYNRAIKEGLVERNYYPFEDFTIKSERTINRALTKSQIKAIEHLDLPTGSPIWKNRQYFILSFNLIGISFSDMAMLRWSNLRGDRIIYKRLKTGRIYSIKLTPKAREIIEYFLPEEEVDKEHFMLPVISMDYARDKGKQWLKAREGNKLCNKSLARIAEMCGIEEKVTTYYTRYSWANIAKDLGYSKDLIAEALGHEYGNRVTGIYLDQYNNEVIDEANERVTGDG